MEKLNILWTTESKETVFNMLSSYAIGSKKNGWWDEVNIMLWGASVKLVGTDAQIQAEVMEMQHQGVRFEACETCCATFNVGDVMNKMGVTIKPLGPLMTEYLKSGQKVLTV